MLFNNRLLQQNIHTKGLSKTRFMKNSFTMAEVLITLAIIGIIAAITIPTIINNYQKKQTLTQLKKIYSEISQSIRLSIAQYGEIKFWDYGNYTSAIDSSKYFFNNYLKLKIVKSCFPTNDECWHDTKNIDGSPSAFKGTMGYGGYSSVLTAGGYSVFSQVVIPSIAPINTILIDINGPLKGANTLGKDVFGFQLDPTYIFEGWGNHYHENDALSVRQECQKIGKFCATIIMRDNWQIKDDYPW